MNSKGKSISKRLIITGGLGLALLVFAIPHSPSARAATLTVTKFTDSADGVCDSDCSLREAISTANADPGADTITLAAGTYTLSLAGVYDDTNATGDLDIRAPLTITGQGATNTYIDGGGLDRVLDVEVSDGEVVIENLTITNGNSPDTAGGVHCSDTTLTIQNATIHGNTSVSGGGGIAAMDGCVLQVAYVVVSGNSATDVGGGLYLTASYLDAEGLLVEGNETTSWAGGIAVLSGSEVELRFSSISGNEADGSGGGIGMSGSASSLVIENSLIADNVSGTEGGGLMLFSGIGATITNTTISGNTAVSYGGGLNSRMAVTMSHSTIAKNTADSDSNDDGNGGGLFLYTTNSVLTVHHSLIADNIDNNNFSFPDMRCWNGSVSSSGYNLAESVGDCSFTGTGDITGEDPLLGPLQENGGRTQTMALAETSPALDAGNPAFTGPPYCDQRGAGFLRVLGGRIDIGAFEIGITYQVFLPVILKN